jgi:hypothetical protein
MEDATIFDDREAMVLGSGHLRAVRPQLIASLVVTIIITAATGLTLMTLVSRAPVSHHRIDAAPHRIAALQHPQLAMIGRPAAVLRENRASGEPSGAG